jgi:hypothetical protein
MTDFSATTAFRLIRRLAAVGLETPSLYLLIADAPAMHVIQADLIAEVRVQLGISLRALAAVDVGLDRLEDVFANDPAAPVTLITWDHWLPKLANSLDRNIILLKTAGAILLLTSRDVAEHMLVAAPNLRNRMSDVLAIRPDEAFGGAVA